MTAYKNYYASSEMNLYASWPEFAFSALLMGVLFWNTAKGKSFPSAFALALRRCAGRQQLHDLGPELPCRRQTIVTLELFNRFTQFGAH